MSRCLEFDSWHQRAASNRPGILGLVVPVSNQRHDFLRALIWNLNLQRWPYAKPGPRRGIYVLKRLRSTVSPVKSLVASSGIYASKPLSSKFYRKPRGPSCSPTLEVNLIITIVFVHDANYECSDQSLCETWQTYNHYHEGHAVGKAAWSYDDGEM